MASSSSFGFFFLSLAVLLQFLSVSVSATKFIDNICLKLVTKNDKDFCYKTLNAYKPVASATTELKAYQATITLAVSYANKYQAFVEKAARENPGLKKLLVDCGKAFDDITNNLKNACEELVEDPETANYDAMLCFDHTRTIHNLIGKNTDKVSKSIITVTSMMEKYIDISVGAAAANWKIKRTSSPILF